MSILLSSISFLVVSALSAVGVFFFGTMCYGIFKDMKPHA